MGNPTKPNYIAWTLVLIIGITTANLATDLIRLTAASLIAKAFTVSLFGKSGQTTSPGDARRDYYQSQQQSQAKQKQANLAKQQRREQRLASEHGQQLQRTCDEWQQNLAKNNSETIRINMEHHCKQLSEYVNQ